MLIKHEPFDQKKEKVTLHRQEKVLSKQYKTQWPCNVEKLVTLHAHHTQSSAHLCKRTAYAIRNTQVCSGEPPHTRVPEGTNVRRKDLHTYGDLDDSSLHTQQSQTATCASACRSKHKHMQPSDHYICKCMPRHTRTYAITDESIWYAIHPSWSDSATGMAQQNEVTLNQRARVYTYVSRAYVYI